MPSTVELTINDPRTGEVVSRVPVADADTCAAAIDRARIAAPGWAQTPAAERAAAVSAAAKAVEQAAAELADLNECETGKTRGDALGGVEAAAGTLMQYAQLGPVHRGRALHGDWTATDLMVPEPHGVVAVLTPWNDPVAVAAGLLGAALVTGNTVMHKPSGRCPRTG
ncbi:MAG: Aldehyde dehydrogenase, partial [Mycobacterium sp.]|nr:Aldehyde dehydrogenase [Mycobacterium sp.]